MTTPRAIEYAPVFVSASRGPPRGCTILVRRFFKGLLSLLQWVRDQPLAPPRQQFFHAASASPSASASGALAASVSASPSASPSTSAKPATSPLWATRAQQHEQKKDKTPRPRPPPVALVVAALGVAKQGCKCGTTCTSARGRVETRWLSRPGSTPKVGPGRQKAGVTHKRTLGRV